MTHSLLAWSLIILLFNGGCSNKPKRRVCRNNYGFLRESSSICDRGNDSFLTVKDRAVYYHRKGTDLQTGRRVRK